MRGRNGPLVVVAVLGLCIAAVLFGLVLSANARFGIEVEMLNRRVQALEEKAGLPPQDLPRRERK